jgi:hypothetical protein
VRLPRLPPSFKVTRAAPLLTQSQTYREEQQTLAQIFRWDLFNLPILLVLWERKYMRKQTLHGLQVHIQGA